MAGRFPLPSAPGESSLIFLFLCNLFLILVDASIGYHVAPALMRRFSPDPDTAELSVRGMRTMLAAVVALYMFFNCLGYYRRSMLTLAVVGGVVLIDMVAQLIVGRRIGTPK